jgi:flagellar biogenesis protein FliO
MAGSARGRSLVSLRHAVVVIVGTGLGFAAVTALAQSPPVRGGVSGELRTPADFSPIELHDSSANAPALPPLQSHQLNQNSLAAGKTPIRRDPATGDAESRARTGFRSPWTTLGTLAVMLIGVVVATRVLRRWTRDTGEGATSHRFDVLAGRRLNAQSSVHLVRIGRRILAVASSPAGVQPLTVIDDPLEVEELLSGGAAPRSRVTGEPVQRLFRGTRAIGRRDDHAPSDQPASSGGQTLRRTSAAFVSPVEDVDA